MTPTDLRDSLAAVSAAVSVPAPDVAAFEARVGRARRRRASARVALATACVAAVAIGASLLPGGEPDRTLPAEPAPLEVSTPAVPIVVDGRLRALTADGELGPAGPAIATLVGTTSAGVVAFLADGSLARVVDGQVTRLVDQPVRTAYVAGDEVLYETLGGAVRRLGEDGVTARTEDGRLMAADADSYVIASDAGVVLHDAAGAHRLDLDGITVLRRVEVAGDTVVASNDLGTWIFADGERLELPDDLVGALSPDGAAWVTVRPLRSVDTATGEVTAVDGVPGRVDQLRWSGEDLLVVSGRSLYRCPAGRDCAEVLSDVGDLQLR